MANTLRNRVRALKRFSMGLKDPAVARAVLELEDRVEELIVAWAPSTEVSLFSSTASGIVPASGGGSTNFLRADGAWAVPPAGGVTDGDKGDITVSGGGTAWAIDAGVVSTTKMGGDVTAAGKALLDDATASDQRTTLGLGTAATQPSSAFAAAVHTHAAADVVSGTMDTARLGSGTANSTTFLRGDQTWAVPAGGGGGLTLPQAMAIASLRP